ncbi:hypothetical protein Y032_0072g642 [Ancylostoma ceylanicum]|uniref:Nep1 ribosome biogenesis protein n=1 Tax=Ancylostoma ceylanicum TaxID=53326 RepID=A0A016TVE1_9BILA|nr:hypothetical protein Y032_0072g642 [Ancylostoma ceylanicum]
MRLSDARIHLQKIFYEDRSTRHEILNDKNASRKRVRLSCDCDPTGPYSSPYSRTRVIKNPVSNYLPVGSRKMLMSFNTEELILPNKLVSSKEEAPLVVVIGGIARGKIVTDYTDQDVKISNYPLSAALTCAKVTSGIEEVWGIV